MPRFFRRTFRRTFRKNRRTGTKRYTGKRYTGKRYLGKRRRIGVSLRAGTAHKFCDRNPNIPLNVIVTPGGVVCWSTAITAYRIISQGLMDVQFYYRPNLGYSNLYNNLSANFTHSRLVRTVSHLKCQLTGVTNPIASGGSSTAIADAYMLICKNYPFQNMPQQATPTALNGDLITYSQCLDNPSFKRFPMLKNHNIIAGPWSFQVVNSQIGLVANTAVYVPKKIGKLTQADQANTWYNGFMIQIEAGTAPLCNWSIETDYEFIMYNPY